MNQAKRAADLPVVAIVGRPNVGKSTLMNRIVGRREAIVEEKPGVTRDRKEIETEWIGRPFLLVDTGGWLASGSQLDDKVSRQSELAIREADAILFVVDGRLGVTDEDDQVAAMLQRMKPKKPIFVIANKIDDTKQEPGMWDLLSLGLGDPYPVSALHGRRVGDLLDDLVAQLPEPEVPAAATRSTRLHSIAVAANGRAALVLGDDELSDVDGDDIVDEASDNTFSVAIVGRPNVGKSTLFNRLIGEERAVVHDMPGTTRDAVDTVVETDNGPIRFVDTAGMRRKSRIDEGTEYYSLVRALQAVDRSDVALLVIDAVEGVTAQDQRLAERIDVAGCPIVILLNKWELLDADERVDCLYHVGEKLRFVGDAPVLKISALSGKGVHKLLPVLTGTIEAYHKRVPTRQVNQVIQAAQAAQPAPHGGRVLYATQGATDPPTFTLFANHELPPTYLRYLERKLREAFDLGATPIKLRVRRRS